MTAQRDQKKRVRARMARTGESYSTARMHVIGEIYDADVAAGTPLPASDPVTATVLKVNAQSARVRIAGEDGQVTLKSADVHRVIPGQLASLTITRRWIYRGDAYASGSIADARTDIGALGLEALPLDDLGPDDPAEWSEPYASDEPYAGLWERFTGRPRPSFEMDAIAWEGREAAESDDPDEAPISTAAELFASGAQAEAREIVMDVLCEDLRCIDAHAHLGNWAWECDRVRARAHYEVGLAIGDLSLRGRPDDLLLLWGSIYNRPYLRCLHGRALCEWRLGELADAERTLERLLSLNPPDNQGARFDWDAVRRGLSWDEVHGRASRRS